MWRRCCLLFGTSSSPAVSAYVASLQRAVQCITGEVIRASGVQPTAQPFSLTLARGETVPLTGGLMPLGFRMRESYALIKDRNAPARNRWQVRVTNYFYALELRSTGRELLAFHWHPQVLAKAFPHVHLESGLELRNDLVGIHVPTGPLALEDVIRFAIEELGVRPRVRGWAAVLERTRAARR